MMTDRGSNGRGWQERFLSSDIATDWKIQLEIQGSADQIRDDMRTNQAIAVFDRSYQNESRAVAWIIEGSTGANQIQGSMITPSATSNHSSFQSKVARIYGIFLTLHALYDNTGNLKGWIELTWEIGFGMPEIKKTTWPICCTCRLAWCMLQFG